MQIIVTINVDTDNAPSITPHDVVQATLAWASVMLPERMETEHYASFALTRNMLNALADVDYDVALTRSDVIGHVEIKE